MICDIPKYNYTIIKVASLMHFYIIDLCIWPIITMMHSLNVCLILV